MNRIQRESKRQLTYALTSGVNEGLEDGPWFLAHARCQQSSPERASVLESDRAKAGAAYRNFLTLWKDADADIPVLQQAKAEYAKLQ